MARVLQGRVLHLRNLGGVVFLVIRCGTESHRLVCSKDNVAAEEFRQVRKLKRGDFTKVVCEKPGRDLRIVQVCLSIPASKAAFALPDDQLDLVLAYSRLLQSIRRILGSDGFVEVRLPSIHFGVHKQAHFSLDFFGLPARLSTSNALHLNVLAIHLCKVFCLQPCFRAEPSRTHKHLAEFDILEAAHMNTTMEAAMVLVERLVKQLAVEVRQMTDVCTVAQIDVSIPFRRISYDEVAAKHGVHGCGLGQHERRIAEDGPIFITDFPAHLASWSAKPSRPGYAQSFNLLLPGVGEVVEGNEKETSVELLNRKFQNLDMVKQLGWYTKHFVHPGCRLAGFGLGVDRLAMWLFGVKNIRRLHPFFRDQRFSEIHDESGD